MKDSWDKVSRSLLGLVLFTLLSFGSRFRVEVAASPLFLLGRCSKVAFKSPVTSYSYDTREGIVSHAWYEILRLSPHLFWLGLFTHRAFLSAQDDDTGERVVSRGGGFAAFFLLGDARKWYSSHGLPVITMIRVGPWRRKSRRGTSEFGLIQRGA